MIVIGIHSVKRKARTNIIHLAGVEVNRFFFFDILALRVCRFHRIFGVGGHLKYIRTTAYPPP